MRKVLTARFFERDAETVARALLGKYLVRRRRGKTTAHMIVETEAYHGMEDMASHAHRGLTARNAPMFGPAGRWYVYFVYGMYWMLNAVTGKRGEPSAVLIRGIDDARGPGKLTKALGITKRQNDRRLGRPTGLWIEDRGRRVSRSVIRTSSRVGVSYAGEWAEKPLRFSLNAPPS